MEPFPLTLTGGSSTPWLERAMPANILIVDDDPGAIQALHNAVRDLGTIRYATSGPEALDLLAEYPIDIILLDARMPGLDGFATCRRIQARHPAIPVIFVTVDNDAATEIRALETGAQDFISKPINPPVVRARIALHLKLKVMHDQLRTLSSRDPLTGLANRRALDERLATEWRRASRHRQPIALLMIDIDHFKHYNDCYGHIQGDECLRQVAATLAGTVTRAEDLVARYGGEEFAVLLPGSDAESAVALAERIRAAVQALAIPHARSATARHVTLSIGVADIRPAIPAHDRVTASRQAAGRQVSGLLLAGALLDAADRALYAAKATGRNRVCVARDAHPAAS